MKSSNLVRSSANESDTTNSYSHDGGDQDQEESGWTAYFDDYFSTKTPQHPASKHINHAYDAEGEYGSHGGDSSMCCSPSTVSDAASFTDARKSLYKTDGERRRRRVETLAAACSSFVGTHKFIHNKLRFKLANNRQKRFGDYYDDSLEDTASSLVHSPKAKGEYGYGHQQEQNDQLKQQVEDANRVLEKKGLCIVPLFNVDKLYRLGQLQPHLMP